jgi:hypothetical protein
MRRTLERPPIWLWLNLLSLDAPVIALVWQDFLSRCYPGALLPTGRVVLGLTVWAIYLADRLLDVRHPARPAESLRHAFYRQHRAFAMALLAGVVAADLVVATLLLRPEVLDSGLLITAGVAGYLAVFPLHRRDGGAGKKPIAAFLFTSGIFVIAWTGTARPGTKLIWPALTFCTLCLSNLLISEHWEHGKEPARRWMWLAFASLAVIAARSFTGNPHWFIAVITSAAGLGALTHWGGKVSWTTRCLLADAVLLTPLFFR